MLVPPLKQLLLRPAQLQPASVTPALKVGVLVDLPWSENAGGHVKCWERLARAAAAMPDALDLTVHFLGPAPGEVEIAGNVRYRFEAPVLSTARFGFLSHVPDHTDLAPWHPRLAAAIDGYDVLHSTGAFFALARTALRAARRSGIPLVSSVHTNTPEYARIFTGQTIERIVGRGGLARLVNHAVGLPRLVERRMVWQLTRYQDACRFVFVSRPAQLPAAGSTAARRIGLLRRGVDRQLFSPQKRDRAWLKTELGIGPDKVVVLYVGRLNRGKNVAVLAQAVAALVRRGLPLHLVCAGDGEERQAIVDLLGPDATCPGSIDPARLARLYATADLFAFPSQVEEYANVVLEALTSGLPVLVASESEMGRVVVPEVTGRILAGAEPAAWAEAIAALASSAERRHEMSRAARAYAELRLPSWQDVLASDLLPRWREVALPRRRHAANA
ncbi:MAG TPA: glycosyltransferase [Stellaceae bacterium]|nr:glycosyltransferase [Stellaceae bacterium]